jgi:hypothetical protein
LLVVDGLSKLMQQEVHNGNLKELHVCQRAAGISHLLFADDTLIFMEANENQAETIKNLINVYEKGTCQHVNPAKCSMVFGALCPNAQQQKVRDVLQVTNLVGDEKYLGLRTSEGRMGKGKFKSTKERLVKRLSSWAERCMSGGAKEVLIKFIARAILTFVMGAFKLPAKLCDEITQLIRRFWSGEESEKRKAHWVAWDNLTRPKSQGGMGFRDMKKFNQALLARQAWTLIQHLDSLCAKLLKARYYQIGDIVDTVFPSEASPTWKGVEHGFELLKKGIIWRIGSGSKVNIWRDPWVNREPSRRITMKKGHARFRWVSQLMVPGRREWNEQVINACMHPHDPEQVLRIRLSDRIQDDHIAWALERTRVFFVRSVCRLAMELERDQEGLTGSSYSPDGSRSFYKDIL